LQHASALNEPYHENDDGDHQQQMDESSTDVKGEESEKPQDQQDHEDRPEHNSLLLFGNPPENFDYASVRDLARREPGARGGERGQTRKNTDGQGRINP